MDKKKIFLSSVLGLCFALGITSNAYAKVDSYVVKDSTDGVVRNYVSSELTNSFLDKKLGNEAPLFDEFNKYFSKYGLYAFHSDKGKYVENDLISKEFIDSKISNKGFNLDSFMEDKNTPFLEIPEEFSKGKALGIIKKGTVIDRTSGAQVLETDKDLYIMTDNVDVKNIAFEGNIILKVKAEGSINLSNISCSSIKIIDAGKGSVNLSNVKADEVKIVGNVKLKSDSNTKVAKVDISTSEINSEVSLEGNFALVEVNKEAKINLYNIDIEKFQVKAKIQYKLDKNVKVKELLGDEDKVKDIRKDLNLQSGEGTSSPGATNPGGNNPGGNDGGDNSGNPGGGDTIVNKIVTSISNVTNGIEVTITINNITENTLAITIEDLGGNYKYIDQIDTASIVGGSATLKLQLDAGEYKGIVNGQAFGKEEFTIK